MFTYMVSDAEMRIAIAALPEARVLDNMPMLASLLGFYRSHTVGFVAEVDAYVVEIQRDAEQDA